MDVTCNGIYSTSTQVAYSIHTDRRLGLFLYAVKPYRTTQRLAVQVKRSVVKLKRSQRIGII